MDDTEKHHGEATATSAGSSGLPLDRAFVVQFTDDTDSALSSCSGRVEHIESGHRVRFRGVDDLLRFVREVLGHARGSGREG